MGGPTPDVPAQWLLLMEHTCCSSIFNFLSGVDVQNLRLTSRGANRFSLEELKRRYNRNFTSIQFKYIARLDFLEGMVS